MQAGGGYHVQVGADLLPQAGQAIRAVLPGAQRALLVSDDAVASLYAAQLLEQLRRAGFAAELWTFPAGEASKNGQTYLALLEAAAQQELGRGDVLVALGGGVTGDLTGFAAATYLRGIAYVQIPTSLLAMVDSSVGGKTGIDLAAGKNLAGAFHQPCLVLCDTSTLKTLPQEEFVGGCAEVIKYGMLGSAELLQTLGEKSFQSAPDAVVLQCIAMKRDIVQRDERDHGERQLLNFGHTLGHALETCSNYQISHGKAVAVGMMLVTRRAVQLGLCPPRCLEVLQKLLEQYGLPMETDIPATRLAREAAHDKKRQGDRLQLVIPTDLGRCALHGVPLSDLPLWAEGGCGL